MKLMTEEKKGFKRTELGLIPEDWQVRPIIELTDVATGNTPKTSDRSNYGGEYLFVSPADLSSEAYIYNTEKKLSHKGFSKSRKFPKNSTLFTCIGSTIGKTGLASEELTSNQQINAVFPSENLHHLYSYYILTFRAPSIKELAGNQAVPIINKTQFQNTKIPLPPTLEEQQAIAYALSDVDELIRSLDGLIQKKQAIKKGTMQQLLTGKKRLPGFDGEWAEVKSGEAVEYINGRAYSKHEWENTGTPVVRLQNLTGSGESYYYSNLNLPEKNYMYEGDLIFMWSASFGPYIWKGPKAIYHYHIWKIDCKEDKIDKMYYYHKLVRLTEELKQTTSGSTMLHLTKAGMDKFKLNLPPLEEQKAIAQILSDMDRELQTLRQKREKYVQIKQGMMQELLTGKTRLV